MSREAIEKRLGEIRRELVLGESCGWRGGVLAGAGFHEQEEEFLEEIAELELVLRATDAGPPFAEPFTREGVE